MGKVVHSFNHDAVTVVTLEENGVHRQGPEESKDSFHNAHKYRGSLEESISGETGCRGKYQTPRGRQ